MMKTVKKEMIYQIASDREINWNKFGWYRQYARYCRYRCYIGKKKKILVMIFSYCSENKC